MNRKDLTKTFINQKEMFGNEHESSPPLSLDHYFKIVYSQKLIRSELHRSAIMQDFRDNGKKWSTGFYFGFFNVKFVMGYPCVRHNILFYIHGPVILHFLS